MEYQEWLTINYTLPKEPSRVRVNVWRKLKKRGAVILGQSVWFLPANKENEVYLQKISSEILQNNGESYIMRMFPQDEGKVLLNGSSQHSIRRGMMSTANFWNNARTCFVN